MIAIISLVLAFAWLALIGCIIAAAIIFTTPGGALFPFLAVVIALTLIAINAFLSS